MKQELCFVDSKTYFGVDIHRQTPISDPKIWPDTFSLTRPLIVYVGRVALIPT